MDEGKVSNVEPTGSASKIILYPIIELPKLTAQQLENLSIGNKVELTSKYIVKERNETGLTLALSGIFPITKTKRIL